MVSLYVKKNIALIDNQTIALGTSQKELINRAAEVFVSWFVRYVKVDKEVHIVCGKGNNGADGYLVAIKLLNRGYKVTVISIDLSSNQSNANQYMRLLIEGNKDLMHHQITSRVDYFKLNGKAVLIDAILGNGINRPIVGKMANLMTHLNESYQNIYALDVPSGLLATNRKTDHAIRAKATCSFEFPRLSFFEPANNQFVGKWDFYTIGLDTDIIEKTLTKSFLLEKNDISSLIKKRPDFAHKGLMGRALIIISKSNMIGASVLSAKACLKMGAGLVYAYADDEKLTALQAQYTEIIFKNEISGSFLKSMKAVCIGPGLGTKEEAIRLIDRLLTRPPKNLILDADALNIIAIQSWQKRIPSGTIITPHIKEFGRLFGDVSSYHERIELQRQSATSMNIYIVLKGRFTSIADPDGRILYNRTGNPALSKAGTGDVLTGVITALRSQSYSGLESCLIGVYVHGYAADLYAKMHHEMTMTPLDLIKSISVALQKLLA